jgi:threonylcarbamoyladenosine tRNA methylthiotransferase MtaB
MAADGFYLLNLGCKVNRIESDTIRLALLEAGFLEVDWQQAKVLLVNSCAVTAEADSKTRKAVRRLASAGKCDQKREKSTESNPQKLPVVIVTGCSAELHKDSLTGIAANVVVIANRDEALKTAMALLRESFKRQEAGNYQRYSDVAKARFGENFATRVGIKIQDGCSNRCNYCIVPIVRGEERSVPFSLVLAECAKVIAAGARELVVCGINIGAYLDDGKNLTELLANIVALEGDFRIRLSSIEPQCVSQELLALMRESSKICRHLHIPLQSGSDNVLRLMARNYDRDEYAELIQEARSLIKGIAISTDCIVGYPGESDEDFQESIEFVQTMAFQTMHVFRYSLRPGTPAATMQQIKAPIVAKRASLMRKLAVKLADLDRLSRVGTEELVLMEDDWRGRGESYHHVSLKTKQRRGDLLAVRYTGTNKEGLLGEALR